MVTHGQDVTRRLNWFDRQFLRAQDFADEQDYALDRRHRHNRLLHTSGVAEGLSVTGKKGETAVTVQPGTAIDAGGRELVLLGGLAATFGPSLATAAAAEMYLVYEEQAVEPSQDPGVTGQATRIREAALVEFRRTDPDPEDVPTSATAAAGSLGAVPGVLLARLSLDGSGGLASPPDMTGRPAAGAVLRGAALPELLLTVENEPQVNWPRLRGESAATIGVTGHVHLAPGYDLQLGSARIGVANGPGELEVEGDDVAIRTGGEARLRVMQSGSVGVGPGAPTARFQVGGMTAIDEGATTNGAWANLGSNAYFDGVWKRVDSSKAGVNLHMNPDGDGVEFRFLRVEADGSNQRNIASIGSGTTFFLESNIGIGTGSPTLARLQVAGKVGNTVGLFGQGEQGISLVASWPNIGFNAYYSTEWRAMAAGRAGAIYVDQNDGRMHVGVATDQALGEDQPLQLTTGASCDGNRWLNASSRTLKSDVVAVDPEAARDDLLAMQPVSFVYRSEVDHRRRLGFIAEDVPQSVAEADRQSLASIGIVALLTSVVQQHEREIARLTALVDRVGGVDGGGSDDH